MMIFHSYVTNYQKVFLIYGHVKGYNWDSLSGINDRDVGEYITNHRF